MRECVDQGVELKPEEVQRLNDLPDAANDVKVHLLCELERGHAGPHVALAQSQDHSHEHTTQWWLRWTSDMQEWAHDEYCPTERKEELCGLPVGHEGLHRFI